VNWSPSPTTTGATSLTRRRGPTLTPAWSSLSSMSSRGPALGQNSTLSSGTWTDGTRGSMSSESCGRCHPRLVAAVIPTQSRCPYGASATWPMRSRCSADICGLCSSPWSAIAVMTRRRRSPIRMSANSALTLLLLCSCPRSSSGSAGRSEAAADILRAHGLVRLDATFATCRAGTIGDYLDVQSAVRYGPPPDSEPADSEPAAPTRRAEQHPPPPDPGPQAPRRGPSLLGVTSGPTTPEARESKCLHRFRPRAPLDPANGASSSASRFNG